MNIVIKWIGVMTIIFLTRHGGLSTDFYVEDKSSFKNPRLIYFGDTIICNDVEFSLNLYFDYEKKSRKTFPGKNNKLVVDKFVHTPKESYIKCGTTEYLTKFFEKGNLTLARSTRIKHQLDYTVKGFNYICEGINGTTNVLIETSHSCENTNIVRKLNKSTSILLIERCFSDEFIVPYRCIGFNKMGGQLSISFNYTLIEKKTTKLQPTHPFYIMTDKLNCSAELTYLSGKTLLKDYLFVIVQEVNSKEISTSVTVGGIQLDKHFTLTQKSEFYYCCEECDSLYLLNLKKLNVKGKYSIFFDVGDQLSYGEIVKCFACTLSTKEDPSVNIINSQCQTTSLNAISEKFDGLITATINGNSPPVLGPDTEIKIPNNVHSNSPIILKCDIRSGVSSSKEFTLTGCDKFKPFLRFFPLENLLVSGDRIYCNSKHTVCSNDFTFLINITTNPKTSYIYNNTQTVSIRPEHSGINVHVTCFVYYKSNISIHNISRTYRIDSKPGELELFNNLPLRTVGDIIICHSTVSPIPTYKWILNGSLSPLFVYNHQLLLINTGIMEDFYNVTCVATNYLGSNTTWTTMDIYNPFNKNQDQNFIFIFILVFTGVVYFFCLIVIISLVFAESVYRVHPKQERRKPKQVLGSEESTAHLDRYDIELPYENEEEGLDKENDNRNNLGEDDFLKNNSCRILSKNTKNIESFVPKNILTSKRRLFLESDVIMKISDVNSASKESKLNFTGHVLNRSDDDYFLEENSSKRRQKISDEILSLQSYFCQKKT